MQSRAVLVLAFIINSHDSRLIVLSLGIMIFVQKGSNVVYSKYAGTEIEFNGVNHLLLKEDDILGFLDTDDIRDLKPLHDRVLIEVCVNLIGYTTVLVYFVSCK